jgi:hypothetical protein
MECMMVLLFLASRAYRERAKILIAFLVWLEMMDSDLNRCRKSPTDQSIVIDTVVPQVNCSAECTAAISLVQNLSGFVAFKFSRDPYSLLSD